MSNKNFAQHLPFGLDRVFVTPQVIPPGEFFSSELTVDGVVGASSDMNVDGSVTPVTFRWYVPTGYLFLLSSFTVQIVDAAVVWTGYGGIAAPGLTNGLVLSIRDADDSLIVALPAVTQTVEFGHFGGGSTIIQNGQAQDLVTAAMDVHSLVGYSLYLTEGQYVEAIVQDNLTGLDHHDAVVYGRLVPTPV